VSNVDDFLAGYEPPCEEVPICGKPGLMSEFLLLESEIIEVCRKTDSLAGAPPEMTARLEELQAAIDASVKIFKVQNQGWQKWADLQAKHPPTPEERATGLLVHRETFDAASVALAAVDPPLTVEQASQLMAKVPPADWEALIGAVWRVHGRQATAGPKSLLLSALRRPSDESSDTPPSEGSLAEPSSDAGGEQ